MYRGGVQLDPPLQPAGVPTPPTPKFDGTGNQVRMTQRVTEDHERLLSQNVQGGGVQLDPPCSQLGYSKPPPPPPLNSAFDPLGFTVAVDSEDVSVWSVAHDCKVVI